MKRTKLILPALALVCATLAGLTDRAAARDELPGISVQPASYFYTGKPYDEDLEGYLFRFRTYQPEVNQWTTTDPSGFPDGLNNRSYVNNRVTVATDFAGLAITLYKKPVGPMGGNDHHSYIYFDVKDCDDKQVRGTVSGQPDAIIATNSGNLVTDPDSDLNSARNAGINLNWKKAGWLNEYCFYLDLIGAQDAYGNNLKYSTDPVNTPGQYNSNGYIHGILNVLGIQQGYAENTAQGWSVPIPLQYNPTNKNKQDCCE